jgi:hypothetical protein
MAERPKAEPTQDIVYASTGEIGPFVYPCICIGIDADACADVKNDALYMMLPPE